MDVEYNDKNSEFTFKIKRFTLIGAILLYFALFIINARFSGDILLNSISGRYIPETAIKGVVTQVQMLFLIVIVLWEEKRGYRIAMLLNALSLLSVIIYTLRSQSMVSMPGIISYIGVFFILTLNNIYKRRIRAYVMKNNKQKQDLLKSEARLEKMAYYDSLTELPNRAYFKEYLKDEIIVSREDESTKGLVYIDLDEFKSINDTLGHDAGDQALIIASKRIQSVIGNKDFLARFGGDEFLVSLGEERAHQQIQILAEKIIQIMKEPITIMDLDFYVTASIGIARFPQDADNAEQLISSADLAMYKAKMKGKNQYVTFTKEMKAINERKLSLTNRLYKVLDKNELFLIYQPKLETVSGKLIGFEALLRWEDKKYGFVSPGEFIPLVEKSGMIKPIGLWVFEEVCKQYNKWKEKGSQSLQMSINMSIEQLKDDIIVDQIKEILERTGVEAKNIEIEITESTAFNDVYNVVERIKAFRDLGLKISIDDFGKEYSSLNRIRTFPIDRLKIDMDFIQRISSEDSKDNAIVKTIIQLANNLDVKVIAEGVETEEQFNFLKKENCDEVQGFLFYKGMRAEEVEEKFGL